MAKLTKLGGARIDVPEASGLAWDPVAQVLLTVGDDSGSAYEIVPGDVPRLSRVIPLEHGDEHDLEGIAVTADGQRMLIASEKQRAVLVYDRAGKLLDTVALGIEFEELNAGLEGLAIDFDTGRIFAVHERKPKRLLELSQDLKVIAQTKLSDLEDLSSVAASKGEVWVLSDESHRVVRLVEQDGAWVETGAWQVEHGDAEGIEIVGSLLWIAYDTADRDNLAWFALPS